MKVIHRCVSARKDKNDYSSVNYIDIYEKHETY